MRSRKITGPDTQWNISRSSSTILYCVEGDHYCGSNLEELTDDLFNVITPERLNFQVYERTTDAEVIPVIYHDLLPDMMPDYDKTFDTDFYQHQVDRVLNLINK